MAITVKHGSKKSIPLMKELWSDVFGDTPEFIDLFFSAFYRPSRTLLAFEDGVLVAMLYYLDINARYNKKKLKCAYLYGVATRLSERRRGHFTRLHEALIEELRAKKYDAITVLPATDSLYGFYRNIGYTLPLKRFQYKLRTQDITETDDLEAIWQLKKENHRRSASGLSILETLPQFIESRKEHLFFSCENSYLAFAPGKDGYELYEVIEAQGDDLPVEKVHYEKSALMMDLTGTVDPELIEKQKAEFSYLLS